MADRFFPEIGARPKAHSGPTKGSDLFRELSSACVDAELARLARSWDLGLIEKRVGSFKPAQSIAESRKKSFHALRSGSRLMSGHAQRIQAAFPGSHVLFWWTNHLGRVLCDPLIGLDQLTQLLGELPSGEVRDLVWEPVHMDDQWHCISRLRPWSLELIQGLENLEGVSALTALACRYRFEQLSANLDHSARTVDAFWRMLPGIVNRYRCLRLGMHTLALSIDYFLSIEPFADRRQAMRFLGPHSRLDARRRSIGACEQIWRDDCSIPTNIKQRRLERAIDLNWRPKVEQLVTGVRMSFRTELYIGEEPLLFA